MKPSPKIFDSIEVLSRQVVILRRHFWRVRKIINILTHKERNSYIEMMHDDISQL